MIMHQPTNSQGNYNYNAFVYTDTFYEPHFHANYELIYVFKGKMQLIINGLSQELCSGEIYLIAPYTVHSFLIDKKTTAWVGVFSDDFVASFSAKNRFFAYEKFRCEKTVEDFLIMHLFYQGTPDRYMLKACLYMVCNECVNNAEKTQRNQDPDFTQKVIRHISEHLGEDLSVQQLAQELNYEYHYFSALFQKCFSINFKTFVNMLRFEQACKLLSDHSRKITQICTECGFGSLRNFNRVFKGLSGVTPSEYRKSI